MESKELLKERSRKRIKELVDGFPNQQEFADFCGISKFSVSQYVNGTTVPGNMNAAKIAKRFSVNPLWIMGFDAPKYTDEQKERIDRYANAAKEINARSLVLSDYEQEIMIKYRKADKLTKQMIDRLLNIDRTEKEHTDIA